MRDIAEMLCVQQRLCPCGMRWVQRHHALRARQHAERNAFSVRSAGLEALQFCSAELVGPHVFLACKVRDSQRDVVLRRPCRDQLEEAAERLCGREELVNASLGRGII